MEDVSIGENWISLANPGSRFEPTSVMELALLIRGRNYQVKFLGAVFDFPSRGLHGISFLRVDGVPAKG